MFKKMLWAILACSLISHPLVAQVLSRSAMQRRDEILQSRYGQKAAREVVASAIKSKGPERRDMGLALLSRKVQAVPVILDELKTASDDERYELLMLIQGQLRWPETYPTIKQTLRNKNFSDPVRGRAATALALFQRKESIPDIQDLFRSTAEDQVRQWSAMSLAVLGDITSDEEFKKMLVDSSPFVQITAAMCLGIIGSDAGLDIAIALSYDDFFGIRCRAAEALSCIDSPQAINRLQEMCDDDPSPTVREQSAGYLGQAILASMEREDALEELKSLLSPENPYPSRWAFIYLVEHYGIGAVDFLQTLAESPGPLAEAATVALIEIDSGTVVVPEIRRKGR